MRREKVEHLVTIGMIKGKSSNGKQIEEILYGLFGWNFEEVTTALKVVREGGVWRDMITKTERHDPSLIKFAHTGH